MSLVGRPASGPADGRQALQAGAAALDAGQPQRAIALLDRAVALLPRSAEARLRQAEALERLGWPAEAERALEAAIALSPRLAEAHARLGIVLRQQGRREDAAAAFRRAAALAPQSSLGRLAAAYAPLALGDAAAAQVALQRVVAIEPRNASAQAELGRLLAEAGDAPGARAAFEAALRHAPGAAGRWYDLVRIRPLGEAERPWLARMQAAAARADLAPLDRVQLTIARGKAHEDLGEHETAIALFLEAGRLHAAIRPLDRGLLTRRVDWQIRHFTRERLRELAADGVRDATPLLVVGMPRSGTTLVESILAAHPEVSAGEELPYWNEAGPQAVAQGDTPTSGALRRMAQDYLAVLRGVGTTPRVTDKKPDNFSWLGLVHAALPDARIVHCRRDPLDVALSVVSNFFGPRPDFSPEAESLLFYLAEYGRLMAHWRAVLPADRFLEVDYEQLVRSPATEVPRLLAFAGLAPHEACLRPEQAAQRVTTASLWQVRQPIGPGAIGRWRRFEPWLGPLVALRGG